MAFAQSSCLILFAKEPIAGRVKTRLEVALGMEGTLDLYRRMLKRQITLLNKASRITSHLAIQLWVEGDCEHADFKPFNGTIHSQQGNDIGERMSFALQQALTKFDSAMLIGCDCPEITDAYLNKAFAVLKNSSDAVFGPAADGGYVLVGLKEHTDKIFKRVDWGSERVMAQSRKHLRENNIRWQELDILHDIDEPEDLIYLDGKLKAKSSKLKAVVTSV